MKGEDVFVLIDIGMCMTQTIHDVTRAILSLISTGNIGRFRVSDDGFRIRQIGIDSQRRECRKFDKFSFFILFFITDQNTKLSKNVDTSSYFNFICFRYYSQHNKILTPYLDLIYCTSLLFKQ